MPICKECGVELEPDVRVCPLCGLRVGERAARPDPDPVRNPEVAGNGEPRRMVWIVVSLFLSTAAVVVFGADFAFHHTITWSAIPLLATAFAWATATNGIWAGQRPLVFIVLETLLALVLLGMIDWATDGRRWFLFPAAPLVLIAAILVSTLISLIRHARLSTLSIASIMVLAVGVSVVATELVLSYDLTQRATVSWSLVTFACTLPPALVLLFAQRQLRKRGPEIRKWFHL